MNDPPPYYIVLFEHDVSDKLKQLCLCVIEWFDKNYGVDDQLKFEVLTTPTVINGHPLTATFIWKDSYGHPRIMLQQRNFYNPAYELLHEFVHYNQWRNKKPINHRGVKQRTDLLFSKFTSENPNLDMNPF